MPVRKKRTVRRLPHALITELADAYEEVGRPEFYSKMEDTFPGEDVRVLYDYHPNLEVFLPLLWFNERDLVEDLADELAGRWAPRASRT